MSGSPPRRRGKDGEDHLVAQLPGITPAWAGKRSTGPPLTQTTVDHPRMGGEKESTPVLTTGAAGSPPHGRGKGHACHQAAVVVGITPAWAGKSSAQPRSGPPGQDHPRVGGEKLGRMAVAISVIGSPPRGRGKVGHNQIAGAAHGITPAWTGKRVHEYKSGRFARDHPRVGGEKANGSDAPDDDEGSPPHGRGKDGGH